MTDKQYYCKLRLSYKGAFDAFSDAGAAALIRAILHHASDDKAVDIPTEIAPTWAIIRDDLDRDREDFENGKKGGKPSKATDGIKPDENAPIDEATRLQAIKYGFDPEDAEVIGRFKNTPFYNRFVDEAMEVCFDKEKRTIRYFIGILRNKAGGE